MTFFMKRFLLFFLLAFVPAFAQAQVKTPLVTYTYGQFGLVKNLYVRDAMALHCPPPSVQPYIKKAVLKAKLDFGDDYNLGSNTVSASVPVTIKAYNTFSGTSGLLKTYNVTLSVTQGAPEQLFLEDFTYMYLSVNRFEVTVGTHTVTPAAAQNAVRLQAHYEEEFVYSVASLTPAVTITAQPATVSANPVTFNWTTLCQAAPNYEFQLLRLYNTSRVSPYLTNENSIVAQVDWTKALSIETGNKTQQLTITIPEGQGFYIWRVRPIGTAFEGGISDARNWGLWSNHYAQGATITVNTGTPTSTTSPASLFFYSYTNLDDDKNWIYSRTFIEGDASGASQVTIGEQMQYASPLLMGKQSQAKIQSEQQMLVTQTVQDFSARPSLSTLPAPVNQTGFNYVENYVRDNSNNLYTAEDFDMSTNYLSPSPVHANSELTKYYSDQNSDLTIPSSTDVSGDAFPYVRTRYMADGNNRPKEQTMAGGMHKLGSGKTVRNSFSGVADIELIRVFGDEAPADISVHKTVATDQNNTSTVSYVSKEGNVIATCLSHNPSGTLLDPLPDAPVDSFEVRDTLKSDMSTPTGVTSSEMLTFTEATDLKLYYDITPGFYTDACLEICRTCDYKITFVVYNLEDMSTPVHSSSMIVDADPVCSSVQQFNGTPGAAFVTLSLPAGDYVVQRTIEAYQVDPGTGNTYLNDALSLIASTLTTSLTTGSGLVQETSATVDMDLVNAYIADADLDGLYAYLGVTSSDSIRHIIIGCDTIVLPILHCHSYDCSDNTPDFEQFLLARWGEPGETIADFIPGYAAGEFNAMITNMLTDATCEYDCEELWTCWNAIVQAYPTLVAQGDATGYPFDPLHQFLSCAGYCIRGFTTTAHGSPGYLSHAYAYFNYTAGANAHCEHIFCCPSVPTCTCSPAQFSAFTPDQWNEFYFCTQSVDPSATPLSAADIEGMAEAMEDSCKARCEDRYDSFVQSLVDEYHAGNFAVEGYEFPGTGTPGGTIPIDQVHCQAMNLVKLCRENCDLTIVTDPLDPTKILSVGTTAELEAMLQAMTWSYDVELQSNQTCPENFESTAADNSGFPNMLVAYLNDQLDNVQEAAGDAGEYWDYADAADDFSSSFGCLSAMNALPMVYVHKDIDSEFATGYTVNRTDKTSDANTIFEQTYFRQLINSGDILVTVRIQLLTAQASGSITYTGTVLTASGFALESGSLTNTWNATSPIPAGTVLTHTFTVTAPATGGTYSFLTSTLSRTGITPNLVLNGSLAVTNCPEIHYLFNTNNVNIASLTTISSGTNGMAYSSSATELIGDVLDDDFAANEITYVITGSFDPVHTSALTSGLPELLPELNTSDPVNYGDGDNIVTYTNALWDVILCSSQCAQEVECPAVCLQWIELTLPDSAQDTVRIITCAEQTCDYLQGLVSQQVGEIIALHQDKMEKAYHDNCVESASILDNFSFMYELNYYHYTLYYYDRAGNLVKTVPPKGVQIVANRMTHPAHTHVSEYQFKSLKNVIKQRTPDGGISDFYYNDIVQLRVSQNAKQLASNLYSYTKYDPLGRMVEAGEYTSSTVPTSTDMNPLAYPSTGTEHEKTISVYTDPHPDVVYFGNKPQRYLQNRVSYTYTDDDGNLGTTNDQAYTYFSYDPHGNAEWLIQEQPEIGRSYIAYEYDLLSGSVLKVRYNEDLADRFFHRYTYDVDKRVKTVETSIDGIIWDKDASYSYYKHGPLRRAAIGEDKVQGLDHVYTLNGWLKGINHSSLVASNDPGSDGVTAGPNPNTAADIWGMILGYYGDDFKRSYSSVASPYNSDASNAYHLAGDPLYNGNISSWTSHVGHVVGTNNYEQLTGNRYRYDALNRIKLADFRYYGGGAWNNTTEYDETFQYDPNGNITQLLRHGHTGQLVMDSLNYKYYNGAADNRLSRVADNDPNLGVYTADINPGQAANNYQYDALGQLTADLQENISSIQWNARGKVKQVTKTTGDVIKFYYDAFGRRVRKESYDAPGGDDKITTTYYVLDADGNTMAVYERDNQLVSGSNYNAIYGLKEQPIYGSARVGQRKDDILIRIVNYNSPGTPAPPSTSLQHVGAHPLMHAPVTHPGFFWFWSSLMPLNTAGTASTGTPFAQVLGTQGVNTASIADECGNTVISVQVLKEYGLVGTGMLNKVMIYDRFGLLMQNINGIKADARGQSVLMPVPGSSQLYYLFTVGTDKIPYYHIIDIAQKKVISMNNILDSAPMYGRSMALIDDQSGAAPSRLYLRAQTATGTTSIMSFLIEAGGISATAPLASFSGGDIYGNGEMQVSQDATKFTVANNKGVVFPFIGGYTGGGELRTYNLSSDHATLSSAVANSVAPVLTALKSLDFTQNGTYVYYYIRGFMGTHTLHRYNVGINSSSPVSIANSGDIRRGNNGKMYMSTNLSMFCTEITTPEGTPGSSTLSTPGRWFTSGLPVQRHLIRLSAECANGVYTRELNNKRYELKDHLYNVRVVLTDVKQSVINPITNLPGNYSATADAYYNYYAFGSEMPKRVMNSPNYRYGFNSQEKDNDISGNGNSYTAEHWQYDGRLGRRWNNDPIAKRHESPYAAFANNPIWCTDPTGADSVKYNDAWYWEVESGDTYWEIGQKTGVPSKNLMAYNQQAANNLKIGSYIALTPTHFVRQSQTPVIYSFTVTQLLIHPEYKVLEYMGVQNKDIATANRAANCSGTPPSCDEFPYASTWESTTYGSATMTVPLSEQWTQGGQLSGVYAKIPVGGTFNVVTVSKDDEKKRFPVRQPVVAPAKKPVPVPVVRAWRYEDFQPRRPLSDAPVVTPEMINDWELYRGPSPNSRRVPEGSPRLSPGGAANGAKSIGYFILL